MSIRVGSSKGSLESRFLILGVDPGLNGGLCIMDDVGALVYQRPMPLRKSDDGKPRHYVDVAVVATILAKYEPSHVFVEKVHSMPRQGVASTFTFGLGYGMILGLLLALEGAIQTELVAPQRWQKMVLHGLDHIPLAKQRAHHKYTELYEQSDITHDGIIDATLIAEYGRVTLSVN